ncbi:hypothetical protein [Roseicella sp. DB1501]|nr:hypothetical protein [Roseicella sp. DB1501]NOG71834.1 hypothetical protein [Roseicella sp. DB1501]
MSRVLSLAALLLPILAACDRPPSPIPDRGIERGTALPPPGLTPPAR